MVTSETQDEIESLQEKEDLRLIEAILFISARFLNMAELVSLSDLNPIMIREFLEKLGEKYGNGESAMMIVQKEEGNSKMWKMDVKPEFSSVVNRIAGGNSEFTKAEQETLAIIAYKNPIKQSVVIKIRGNKAYDHVKKFSDLGLVRKKKEGHTYILELSEDFYDYFNIEKSSSKEELKVKVKEEENG
jgi:segregation and condensation protein B